MLIGSQEYCGLGRGLSGLHWVWCSGTGPRLKLRWETLCSSPFLTSIAGSLQSWNRRVRPLLVLRNGTLLSSRVVHRVTAQLSCCIWNLRFCWTIQLGCQCPFVLLLHPQGYIQRSVWSSGCYKKRTGKSVSFGMWHDP